MENTSSFFQYTFFPWMYCTRPHCTHQRVSRFGGYLLFVLHGIVLISHLSSSKINWSTGVTEAFAIFFFFVFLDKTWHLNCKYIKKSCCFKKQLKVCSAIPPSNDLQGLSLLKDTLCSLLIADQVLLVCFEWKSMWVVFFNRVFGGMWYYWRRVWAIQSGLHNFFLIN